MQHQAGMHLSEWHVALPSSSARASCADSEAESGCACSRVSWRATVKGNRSPDSIGEEDGSRGPL